MTPEQKQAVVDYFNEAREAIDGTGRHQDHALTRVGRCIYCSCGYRVGQGTVNLKPKVESSRSEYRGYRVEHTSIPRPPGDRRPGAQ